jgi:hypothetical protein
MTYEIDTTDYLIERFVDAMHVCNQHIANRSAGEPLMRDGTPAQDVTSPIGKRLRDHTPADMQELDRLLGIHIQIAIAAEDNRN